MDNLTAGMRFEIQFFLPFDVFTFAARETVPHYLITESRGQINNLLIRVRFIIIIIISTFIIINIIFIRTAVINKNTTCYLERGNVLALLNAKSNFINS